ncbi:MAG: hypothetical protein AB7O59_09855 [Pirellulales bacterium]
MARQINTLADLQAYVRTLQANSLHHAEGMLDVFPKVLVAAIGRMDPSTLHAYERESETKNAAWCDFNGESFFFSYDHQGAVTVKAGNMQGPIVERFDDSDTFDDISRRIARLGAATVQP